MSCAASPDVTCAANAPAIACKPRLLVNEAYVRLVDYKRMQWQNRAHFFAVSAQLMRRILVEHARGRNLKRGGGVAHVPFDEALVAGTPQDTDLVALDIAMQGLSLIDPRKVQSGRNALLRRP